MLNASVLYNHLLTSARLQCTSLDGFELTQHWHFLEHYTVVESWPNQPTPEYIWWDNASRASVTCRENPSIKMAAIVRTRFLYRIVNRTYRSDVRTASLHENEYTSARLMPDDSNFKIIPIEGVIFDMDGTLTVPAYDFVKLRERLGLPHGVDILKAVEAMDSSESRAAAHKVIEEFEEEGLRGLQLQPHAVDLLRFVSQHSVARALVTRNSQRSVQVFLTALQAGLMDGASINENGQNVPWPIFSEVNCASAIVAVCIHAHRHVAVLPCVFPSSTSLMRS